MTSKIVGLDIGYANTKIVTPEGTTIFPSVVGSPEQAKFDSINADHTMTIRIQNEWRNVGRGAVVQSENTIRRNERGWYSTPEYLTILHAALLQIAGNDHEVNLDWVVTGLPVAYFEDDREKVAEIVRGQHKVETLHNGVYSVNVRNVSVIPQGTGALIYTALDDIGRIVDAQIATGNIGMIDIGGKTTNIISSQNMIDVSNQTRSIVKGGWDAIDILRPLIEDEIPELNVRDHVLQDAIVNKQIKWGGKLYDLAPIIRSGLDDFADTIINRAEQVFGKSGGMLDTILVSGGGAALVGDIIVEKFDHTDVRVVDDPVFANARGYYRLGVKFGS